MSSPQIEDDEELKNEWRKKPPNLKNSAPSSASVATPKFTVRRRLKTKLDCSIVQGSAETTDSVDSVIAKIAIENSSAEDIELPKSLEITHLWADLHKLKNTPEGRLRKLWISPYEMRKSSFYIDGLSLRTLKPKESIAYEINLSSLYPIKRGRYMICMRLNVSYDEKNVYYVSNKLIKEFKIFPKGTQMILDNSRFVCNVDSSVMSFFSFHVGKDDDYDDDDDDHDDDDDDDDDDEENNFKNDPFDTDDDDDDEEEEDESYDLDGN